MIIVAIIALATVVLVALYAILSQIPPMPSEVMTTLAYFSSYFSQGLAFLYSITYENVIKALFGITVTVEVLLYGYKFTMWVAKKIPMFGVSD